MQQPPNQPTDTDQPAPLSAGELAALRGVLEMLKHPRSSGNYVWAQGQAIDAFERLLAMAESAAGLRAELEAAWETTKKTIRETA